MGWFKGTPKGHQKETLLGLEVPPARDTPVFFFFVLPGVQSFRRR